MDHPSLPPAPLPEILIGWTTVPDKETALTLARAAVQARLAACVQIGEPILSVYHWEGKLCEEQETRVTFKFAATAEPQLRALIVSLHPYQTPQWLATPITHALPEYATWLTS